MKPEMMESKDGVTTRTWGEWFDLRTLSAYSSISENSLRQCIHAPSDPLPAFRQGAKFYVRRSDFDAWMLRRRVKTATEIDKVVNDIVNSLTT